MKVIKECDESKVGTVQGSADLCPRCKKNGIQVPGTAVLNLVNKELTEQIQADGYYICPNQSCKIVYFNPLTGHIFDKNNVRVKVWLKDQGDDVPLCYCNKITRGEIREAWNKGAGSYAEVFKIAGASRENCNCRYENPAGRCCSGVINEFLKTLNQTRPLKVSEQCQKN